MTGSVEQRTIAAVEVVTESAEETRALATHLAAVAGPGDRIALSGPLGAGKTVFAKGFAAGLGVREVVNSPSFTLMAEYQGRLPLFHQDMYRLTGAEEVLAGGLLDERQEDGVTVTEWADRLPTELDPKRLTVDISILGGDRRRLTLGAPNEDQARYLEAAASWRPAHRRPAGDEPHP